MKQAILNGPLDMIIKEQEIPPLEPGDCLLRVQSALVCGTDIRIYEGTKKKNVTYPTVMGHEFAGTIAESNGPLPHGLVVGDLVAVYPIMPCGHCSACVRGRENICRNRLAFGYQIPGAFAEYVHVPAAAVRAGNLVKVNGVRPNSAAVIEPLSCAYNGLKLIDAPAAHALLVVGCGPLGLMHIRLASALGVKKIVAVDPSAQRLSAAAKSGAQLTLAPGDTAAREILEFTDGDGVDAMVVAVGRTDAFEPYLEALSPGAKVNLFAGFPTGKDVLAVSANDVHYNEYSLIGSSSCHLSDFEFVASMVTDGTLQVDDLVTTTMEIEEAVAALEAAKAGDDLRVGITARS
ncbi:alcohol dehydrogenase catalytic domain-containing protein [Nesterenkonia sandarakina]|uniref:Threonine dehydrogenase-like Zn-dependent dehydrogenase n=1 Tax=Nesterenkonia sandarakina TaxID=272918 RepID=A0A2T0YA86_9MICC|nr:alcohol dehydrogenase catalytic domain-containing protein [Nesterenkonia sandarakina]PRZ11611.1 threonine dehydrogenase-like Zn-dependent dehydrogenase [Nesterenkonia sandarakina]